MKKFIFGILFLLSFHGSAFAEVPVWQPLEVDSRELPYYLDTANFESNLGRENVFYEITFWIRSETLEPETFIDQQYVIQQNITNGIIRYRLLKNRYVSSGNTLDSVVSSSWQRLTEKSLEWKIFYDVLEYDQQKTVE